MTQRLPFQQQLHQGVEESVNPYLGLFHLTLIHSYNALLIKKVSSTIFESLIWLNLGLNPGLPDRSQTLTIMLMFKI